VKPGSTRETRGVDVRKHGPEATKQWVHLTDEGEPLFDQTNGAVSFDAENTHRSGLSDEERIAYAGAISAAQGNMVGGF
jgi:hypothetical protein